jgi:predicted Zn-dependent peptidase
LVAVEPRVRRRAVRALDRRGRPPHQRSVLPNGLRVVTQAMPGARSVSVGLFVGVGSRHETGAEIGLSHMLEHLVFKGTRGYPEAGAISAAVEGCGGYVNAATDRELTAYSAKLPREQAPRALEVVRELVLRPLLRREDLRAEKPVIIDEIRMYVDSPSDHVFTLFDELLFGAHPLGREIAGSPAAVRRVTHPAAVAHWSRWYRPKHLVLAAAGAVEHEAVVKTALGWFTDDEPMTEPLALAPRALDQPAGLTAPHPTEAGALRVAYRRLGQGNLCLGMPGLSRTDPDRWALELLGAVLGDGMSSRLFLELRERRSLAYDVSTFAAMYADCGTFGVHAGFEPDAAERVVSAILQQLDRVVNEPIAAHELDRARAYTRGRLELRMEDSAAVTFWLGTGESLLPAILTPDEVIEQLEAVTPDDMLRVARRIARPDLVRLVALGPFRGTRRFAALVAA